MSSSRSLTYLKQFIPPFFFTLVKKGKKYGWKGDYKSWMDAKNSSDNYENAEILEKVKHALLKVKQGEAIFERDSVLFSEIHYSWPLLSALLWIANLKKGVLHVADFGGSLGSSYFQNRKFLCGISVLHWNIIEQKNFVDCGRASFQDDTLRFYYNPEQLVAEWGIPDLLVFSCVLPYLEKPYEVLENLKIYKIPFVIIDDTYFNYESRDRICVQRVPPKIYNASYPCWMLNYEGIKSVMTKDYELISEHENDSQIFLDGKKIQYRGMLFKLKR